ncbi:MAG: hypothetical protein A3G33_09535 [Omnitrophica bacterium RIFCSPLOWO2_12_FULL_44_17]|uniref:Uncharacterized protein n=1 Tax=Candidatus Danuiimicrobium aquiferis TaxID=1801832 RepID=A0A1G1KWX8_9BACT|nr:MAG: hypothetical protein A3B72_09825 [Omnitrophica bacterium RIFCSPHIGHO2_02_FULL_45_28]OGW97423.1 MAG: hypothetical protein A3G33_09535 [Omnitrophica bacterium RIFCSPLOWO2_12_FULL_44_17]OGX04497.1 MAG: hypothetical protein A3J12_10575 [Omnitrophica bacterium RIFCSPLOWO2_02_FULL_44_11]
MPKAGIQLFVWIPAFAGMTEMNILSTENTFKTLNNYKYLYIATANGGKPLTSSTYFRQAEDIY